MSPLLIKIKFALYYDLYDAHVLYLLCIRSSQMASATQPRRRRYWGELFFIKRRANCSSSNADLVCGVFRWIGNDRLVRKPMQNCSMKKVLSLLVVGKRMIFSSTRSSSRTWMIWMNIYCPPFLSSARSPSITRIGFTCINGCLSSVRSSPRFWVHWQHCFTALTRQGVMNMLHCSNH